MYKTEWSRSRFWLGHFLYSRHGRLPITWEYEPSVPLALRTSLAAWISGQSRKSNEAGHWLVERTLEQYADDPAYIQTLRLVITERQHHQKLLLRLLELIGPVAPARQWSVYRTIGSTTHRLYRRLLGPRFEMSMGLLYDLIDLAIFNRIRHACETPAVQGVCDNIGRDKRAHLAFGSERLTMLYAEFNFLRRNLRRCRLRLMCGALLIIMVCCHGHLIRAIGTSRWRFVTETYGQFLRLLERMVPYRRESLLAALRNQRQDPYASPQRVLR